tara:strand:+ start:11590 stop:12255 length:666 start_codon:yes stop_codon:yes gene_type:complete
MSISTKDIKTLLNRDVGKHDWKRATKRKFTYDNVLAHPDTNLVLNGTLNWRCFYDTECDFPDEIYILDDGNKIIAASTEPFIPGDSFEGALYPSHDDSYITFMVEYKESFKVFPDTTELCSHDVREYTIAGFRDVFYKHGLLLFSDAECFFTLKIIEEEPDVDTYQQIEYKLKAAFEELGIHYSNEMEENNFKAYGSKLNYINQVVVPKGKAGLNKMARGL